MIFLCQLVHLYAVLLGPINCELRFAINSVSLKTIVNSLCNVLLERQLLFAACFPRYESEYSFCSSVFSVSSPLLDHVVRDRESIQSSFVQCLAD